MTTAMPRIVPRVPRPGERLKILIDTDAANEIDDLYAVALALSAQDRFDIKGFVACHFAAKSGPESIEESYQALMEPIKGDIRQYSFGANQRGHQGQSKRS